MEKSTGRAIGQTQSGIHSAAKQKEKTIEIYEQINTLESQRIAFESSRDNLQELEAVEYADFCGLIDSFFALQEESFRFRTFIRDYIKSITVYRESVVFSLDCGFGLLDGVDRKKQKPY